MKFARLCLLCLLPISFTFLITVSAAPNHFASSLAQPTGSVASSKVVYVSDFELDAENSANRARRRFRHRTNRANANH